MQGNGPLMTSDALYLGLFGGMLATIFLLSLFFANSLNNRHFLLVNLLIAGFGCFLLLDRTEAASLLGLNQTEAWIVACVAPLFMGMAGMTVLLRRTTNLRENAPTLDQIAVFCTVFLVAGLAILLVPVVLALAGQPALAVFLEERLLPTGFAVVTGIGVLGWLATVLIAPVQPREWRIFSQAGVGLAAIFFVCYNLTFFGKLDPTLTTVNALRAVVAFSCFAFMLAYYRHATIDATGRERIAMSRAIRLVETSEASRSREAMSHGHTMRVIKREKELEAELRTQQAERMEALRQAKEAADEVARSKSQFLAFMSHEIRTPLNGIMGMVRLLMNTEMSAEQRDFVQTLNYSGDALLSLVNDTLDISKIEAGQLTLEEIDFDLQRLISSSIMLMSARASEKGLLIRSDIGTAVPRFIKGDPTRLRQILMNLINNALKFTEKGGVTVAVRLLPAPAENRHRLRLEIQDTGIGIPASARDKLFKEYSQVDSSTSRLYGGTGLGLSICKQLVQAMGGEIGVDSVDGYGSTFWFVIDFGQAEGGDTLGEFAEKAPDTPELSVMVIEDNEIHQKVIGGYLHLDGHQVTLVMTAEEALDLMVEKDFDALLMDVNLPGIDGNEATRRIRHLKDPVKASIPIIAITGNTSPLDIEGCRAAGMDDFVGKPVDPDALRAAVLTTHRAWQERWRSDTGARVPAAASSATRLRTVLIVDDNEINQKVIAGFLRLGGHQTEAAYSGEVAVEMAGARLYDAILMDVTLPGIDGLEASRRIRQLPDRAKAAVPILAVTGNIEADDVEACRQAGMNEFLGKPIAMEALEAALARLPATVPDSPAGGSTAAAIDSLDDYLPQAEPTAPLLSQETLDRLGHAFDRPALGQLFEDMLKESGILVAAIETAQQDDNRLEVRAQAHTLKGMAMTLGVVQLGDLAADLETAVQRQATGDELVALVTRLQTAFELSKQAIAAWRVG